MLPIPKAIWEDPFDVSPSDYAYLVKGTKSYAEEGKAMINKKAKQVLVFLKVLEISLELEQLNYEKVYTALLSEEGFMLPNVNLIREKVLQELRNLQVDNLDRIQEEIGRVSDALRYELTAAFEAVKPNLSSFF